MDNYITITNLAFLPGVLKVIGRYNGKDVRLQTVKDWLTLRGIGFNFDGIHEPDVLHLTPITHLDTPHTLCFVVEASPYFIMGGK